jgi:hypothetical protein
MTPYSRYPKLNDKPHTRPILSMYGKTWLGELVWLLIPIAVLAFGLLLR